MAGEVTIRADSIKAVHPLFQVEGGGSIPTSALHLWFSRMFWETAVKLNRLWHRTLPEIRDPKNILSAATCYGAQFRGVWFAAAIWTKPVARMLPRNWLELRRFPIGPDAPRYTASRMLGWMARDIRKFEANVVRLISYQDASVHSGGIYRAAGWNPVAVRKGGEWSCATRERPPQQSTGDKIRWELEIIK